MIKNLFIFIFFLIISGNHLLSQKKNDINLTKQEKDWIKKHSHIRLVPYPSYPPAEFINEEGEYQGIAVDYLKIIKEKTGLNFNLVMTVDWTTTLKLLKEKKIDLIPLASHRPDRDAYALFSKPYLNFPMVIITKNDFKEKILLSKENKDQEKSFLNDTGYSFGRKIKTFAVVKGYAAEKYLIEKFPNLKIISVRNEIEGLRKVSFSEVTAFISDLSVSSYYINKEGISNLKISGELDYRYKLGFALRNDWPELKNILNKALLSIDRETKQNIFRKWVSIHKDSILFSKNIVLGSIILFLIFAIIIILFYIRNKSLKLKIEAVALERKKAELDRQEAQNASVAKSAFLANMSHEIRTPMNAILGFTSILKNSFLDERQKEYLMAIDSSSKSLLRLINDILDLSKVEANKLELEYSYFDIKKLVNEMRIVFQKKLNDNNLDYIVEVSENFPEYVYLDEIRIRQILLNLIGNAVKFTKQGYIKIKLFYQTEKEYNKNGSIMITVVDTGIGISKDNLNKIFDAFQQQDNQKYSEFGGTGLGLTITRRLTEMMNGNVFVLSELNKGSKFILTFDNIKVSRKKIENKNLKISENRLRLNTNIQVLIIDSIVYNSRLIHVLLESKFIQVFEARNGSEALDIILKHNIDIVFADIRLPKLSGYRIAKKIRKNHSFPIVAMTNSVSQKINKRVSFFDNFLVKPVTKEDLYFIINFYFSKNNNSYEELKISKNETSLKDKINKDNIKKKIEFSKELLILYQTIQKEYMEKYRSFKGSLRIKEIEEWLLDLENLEKRISYIPLKIFIKETKIAIQIFNIAKVENNLNEFENIMNNLKEIVEKEK